MAASLNKVFLMGNLTRDPEQRFLPSGQSVVNFSIGVNRNYVTQSGERKSEATFVRIVVWGKMGEACHQYLRKGSPVFVEGRLQSRSWEAPDGSKRSSLEVIASTVQFLARGGKEEPKGESYATEEMSPEPGSGIGIANEATEVKAADVDWALEEQPPF